MVGLNAKSMISLYVLGITLLIIVGCSDLLTSNDRAHKTPVEQFSGKIDSSLTGTWVKQDVPSYGNYRTFSFAINNHVQLSDSAISGTDKKDGIWQVSNDTIFITYSGFSTRIDTIRYGFSSKYDFLYLSYRNEWSRYSPVDSSIVINPGKSYRCYPYVKAPDDTIVAILDTITLHATAEALNPIKISKFLWSLNGGVNFDTLTDSTYRIVFKKTQTGSQLILVKVIDNSGNVSLPSMVNVTVKQYPPTVEFNNISYYMNDNVVLHADGKDPNGTIKRYYWTIYTSATTKTDTIISSSDSLLWKFNGIGAYLVSVFAEDDDSLRSFTVTDTVHIVPHTYGTAGNENSASVVQTTNSDFVIAGYSYTGGIVIRTDSTGHELWRKQYTGNNFHLYEIINSGNNETAVIGSGGRPDIVFIILDRDGNEIISKTITSTNSEVGKSIVKLPEGGFLICGDSYGSQQDTTNGVVYRIDNIGNVIWKTRFVRKATTYTTKIILTSDGAAMVLGSTWESVYAGAVSCGYIMKINLNGGILWSKALSSKPSNFEVNSILETSDNHYLITGPYRSGGYGGEVASIFDVVNDGTIISSKTLVPQIGTANTLLCKLPANGNFFANSMGDYYNNTQLTTYLSITDESGKQLYYQNIADGSVNGCCITLDGNVIIVGQSFKYGKGNGDILLMKVDGKCNRVW